MPLKVPCPNCRGILTIGEELQGKSVRCPRCKTVFKAPSPAGLTSAPPTSLPAPVQSNPREPAEEEMPGWMSEALSEQRDEEIEDEQEDEQEEEQEEEQDEQLDKAERRGWRNVRSGVLCVLAATLIPFGAGLVAVCLLMQGKDSIGTAASLSLIGNAVGGLLSVLGKGLCCAVPRRAGGKVLAGAATALTFLAVVIWAYLTMSSLEEPAPGKQKEMAETLRWIAGAYVIASGFGMFCWLLFLHHVCSHLRARGPSIAVVIYGLIGVVGVVSAAVILHESKAQNLAGNQGEASSDLLGMVVGLLVLLLFYVGLLAVIAGVVGRQTKNRAVRTR